MVQDIKISLPQGYEFTMEQNDWECAPDPICCTLIDAEGWQMVADDIRGIGVDFASVNDPDEVFDAVWAEYEKSLLRRCKVFYYEDLTDEEFNALEVFMNKPDYENLPEYQELCLSYYKRIKSEE